jgi:SAM-dependent methyltransferase
MDPGDRLCRAEERAHYGLHENSPADPAYRAFLNRLAVHLVPLLPAGAEGLDFGCGPGPTLSVMLREQGFRMTDYDPFFVPDQAALARRYDFITCTEAAEHFFHPALEFARLDALIRPGGRLGVMTRLLEDDDAFAGWSYRRDPTHVVFYKRATFAVLAANYGWSVEFPAPDIVLCEKRASAISAVCRSDGDMNKAVVQEEPWERTCISEKS